METQLKSVMMTDRGPKAISVFGYANNGLPGLEIIIPGVNTKRLKEKFIFLTKSRKLPIPLKRYMICAETRELTKHDSYDSLELSMIILFWHLAGLIPIMNLSDCFCAGTITSTGQISHLNFTQKFYEELMADYFVEGKKNYTVILDRFANEMTEAHWLPTHEILNKIPDLFFIKPKAPQILLKDRTAQIGLFGEKCYTKDPSVPLDRL